jgi:four helix bundle protein
MVKVMAAIHKLGIGLKELRESRVWLRMSIKCELLPSHKLAPLVDECSQLMKIFGKSIVTAKANAPKAGRRRFRTNE